MVAKTKYRNIKVRKETFADVNAVSKRFKVSKQMVYYRINRNETDLIGLNTRLRIECQGHKFETVQDCARFLNCSTNAVYKALDTGTLERLAQRPRKPANKETVYMNHKWQSRTVMARDLGCSVRHVLKALKGELNASNQAKFDAKVKAWIKSNAKPKSKLKPKPKSKTKRSDLNTANKKRK